MSEVELFIGFLMTLGIRDLVKLYINRRWTRRECGSPTCKRTIKTISAEE